MEAAAIVLFAMAVAIVAKSWTKNPPPKQLQQSDVRHLWQAEATRNGWRFTPTSIQQNMIINGMIEKYYFEVTPVTQLRPTEHFAGNADYTMVTVPLRNPNLPEMRITTSGLLDTVRKDIQIGIEELDQKLLIQGDPKIIQNLKTNRVRELLGKMASGHPASRIEKKQVIWCHDGLHASCLEQHINDCIALAQAIDASEHEIWSGFSTAHGLGIHHTKGALALRGFVDSHKVRIQMVDQSTQIMVHIGDYWPQNLRILPGKHPNAIPTYNPILDPLISVVGMAQTPFRFSSTDLAENLLAVLHAYPKSSVSNGMVCLVFPGQEADDLGAPLHDALALAKLLKTLTQEN